MNHTKPTLAERKCGPGLEDHSIPSQQSFVGFHRTRGPTNVGMDGDPMEISLANCPDSRPSDSNITTPLPWLDSKELPPRDSEPNWNPDG